MTPPKEDVNMPLFLVLLILFPVACVAYMILVEVVALARELVHWGWWWHVTTRGALWTLLATGITSFAYYVVCLHFQLRRERTWRARASEALRQYDEAVRTEEWERDRLAFLKQSAALEARALALEKEKAEALRVREAREAQMRAAADARARQEAEARERREREDAVRRKEEAARRDAARVAEAAAREEAARKKRIQDAQEALRKASEHRRQQLRDNELWVQAMIERFEVFVKFQDETYLRNYARKYGAKLIAEKERILKERHALLVQHERIDLLRARSPATLHRAMWEVHALAFALEFDVEPAGRGKECSHEYDERKARHIERQAEHILAKEMARVRAAANARDKLHAMGLDPDEVERRVRDLESEIAEGGTTNAAVESY